MAEADFEPLLDLSIRVLLADPERVGRRDSARRRRRLWASSDPTVLSVIQWEGREAGCVGLTRAADHFEIHSFCLEPWAQGRGLGTTVVAALAAGCPLPVRVLRQSPALGFWERQGFRRIAEQHSDWLCERPAPEMP